MATPAYKAILLLCFLVLITSNLWKRCWSAQQAPSTKPSISIVSPVDGTVVQPGEILHIDVSVPSDKQVRGMTIISPLGMSNEVRESLPWSFTLTIPKDDSVGGGGPLLGKHPVYAHANLVGPRSDAGIDAIIIVDVERPDMPIQLWTQNSRILPEAFGEEERIIVVGIFSDGSELELNESSCLSFASSDENVAAVASDGKVTAVGPGHAMITAIYRRGDDRVQLPIPVNFSPPAMNVEPRLLDFGEQQVGTPSAPLQVTLTNTMHGPMKIYNPEIHGEFSEADDCDSSSPLREEGGTCIVNVIFTPRDKGLRLGELNVGNSYSAVPTTIRLSGTGRQRLNFKGQSYEPLF